MKKVLALLLALSLIFVLVSCNKKLSGTYVNDGLVSDITYEFKGNKVTVTDSTILGDVTYSGKYKITKNKDKGLQIQFIFEDEHAEVYNKTCTFEETEDGFKLNGLPYVKK